MDLTREQILQTNLYAIDAAFCSDEEKARLKQMVYGFGKRQGIGQKLVGPCAAKVKHMPFLLNKSESDSFFDRVYLNSQDYV